MNEINAQALLTYVLQLAQRCRYEKEHSHQVTKLALRLFDELQTLHRLSPQHRLLLESASLLHDIGWIKGREGHHKTARDIILKSSQLPLNRDEKVTVALVARYHRRAVPKATHKYFRDLSVQKQLAIKKLAALLRVADGLDRRHMSSVKDLSCVIKPGKVVIKIQSDHFAELDRRTAQKKSDLFRKVFQKELVV